MPESFLSLRRFPPGDSVNDAWQKLHKADPTRPLLGWFFSPSRFGFFTKDGPAPPADAFEIRAFRHNGPNQPPGLAWELRWLRDGETGTTVIVQEGGDTPDLPYLETLNTCYLLWGTGNADGRLQEARIAPLTLPGLTMGEGQHVQILGREYLIDSGLDGNVVVGEELYVGLSIKKEADNGEDA